MTLYFAKLMYFPLKYAIKRFFYLFKNYDLILNCMLTINKNE